MSRYDLATKKEIKKRPFVSAPDTIGDDLKNFVDSDEEKGVQTPIRGKSVVIRGPNGYQVAIPTRNVREMIDSNGEFWLRIPPSVARGLQQDIRHATEDPNERIRLADLQDDLRQRRNHLPFG